MMKRNQVPECDGCDSQHPWFLHNIRHRGILRRFCTSCVLKFNSGSFCAVCFQVFDSKDRVLCLKCPSIAHIDCINKDSSGLYTCPPCSDPSFSFFDSEFTNQTRRIIDFRLAKALVAAAQISSASIAKAAAAKCFEAEFRLKEAAFSRKRLKDALDVFSEVSTKVKPCEDNKVNETANPLTPVIPHKKKKKKKRQKISHENIDGTKKTIESANQVIPLIAHNPKIRKKKKKKTSRENINSQKETIEAPKQVTSLIAQNPKIKKKKKKKTCHKNVDGRKETIGAPPTHVTSLTSQNPRIKKKKKKKSKSIRAVTVEEWLRDKLKAESEQNDMSQKIKESSSNVDSFRKEGVSRVSLSNVMKRSPNSSVSIHDGDKLKHQNCAIAKAIKSSNQTISESHVVKEDKEIKGSHPVHQPPDSYSVN